MKKFLFAFSFIIVAFIGLNVCFVFADDLSEYNVNTIDVSNVAYVSSIARELIKEHITDSNYTIVFDGNGTVERNYINSSAFDNSFSYCYVSQYRQNSTTAYKFTFTDVPAHISSTDDKIHLSGNAFAISFYLGSSSVTISKVIRVSYLNNGSNECGSHVTCYLTNSGSFFYNSDGFTGLNGEIFYRSADIYKGENLVFERNLNYNYGSSQSPNVLYSISISGINTYVMRVTPYNIGTPYSLHAYISYFTEGKADDDWLLEDNMSTLVTTGHHVDMDVSTIDYVFSWTGGSYTKHVVFQGDTIDRRTDSATSR